MSALLAAVIAVTAAGCTSTLSPSDTGTGTTTVQDTQRTNESPVVDPTSTAPVDAGESTAPASSDVLPPSTAAGEQPATSTEQAPTSYLPAADAEAVDGDCPYLSKDDVQSATGQRMGQPQVRAAGSQPTCEFVRNDGTYLATVRVLQFDTDAEATSAVDFYVPRELSNPENKPTGWSGGSMPTDAGSIVAVSKGGWAVIAQTNLPKTVGARSLVTHTIENLGL